MADHITIPINKKRLGKITRAVVCLTLGFLPFWLGAAITAEAVKRFDLGLLAVGYVFFLLMGLLIYAGFVKDDPDVRP